MVANNATQKVLVVSHVILKEAAKRYPTTDKLSDAIFVGAMMLSIVALLVIVFCSLCVWVCCSGKSKMADEEITGDSESINTTQSFMSGFDRSKESL